MALAWHCHYHSSCSVRVPRTFSSFSSILSNTLGRDCLSFCVCSTHISLIPHCTVSSANPEQQAQLIQKKCAAYFSWICDSSTGLKNSDQNYERCFSYQVSSYSASSHLLSSGAWCPPHGLLLRWHAHPCHGTLSRIFEISKGHRDGSSGLGLPNGACLAPGIQLYLYEEKNIGRLEEATGLSCKDQYAAHSHRPRL